MNKHHLLFITLLRVSLGWYFFWAGITKVLDPNWSAAGFLENAKMFPDFYTLFLTPSVLPVINLLNEWGITLVGVGLIFGVSVRLCAYVGVLLMFMYYFPHDNPHGFIVDEHIIFSFALLVLAAMPMSREIGIYEWCTRLSFVKHSPALKKFLS